MDKPHPFTSDYVKEKRYMSYLYPAEQAQYSAITPNDKAAYGGIQSGSALSDYAQLGTLKQQQAAGCAVPKSIMFDEGEAAETLAGTVKDVLRQAERLESLAAQIESSLFRQMPNMQCGQTPMKDTSAPTVTQNISAVVSRLYSSSSILEDILSKIGGR